MKVVVWSALALAAISLPRAALAAPSQLVAGDNHTCLLRDGTVWCWGDDEYGQASGTAAYLALAPVVAVRGATAIAAGATSTCAVVAEGLRCWGSGERRFVGEKIIGLSIDADRSCAITSAGGVRCVAKGGAAVVITGVANAVELANGCARTAGGEVACWDRGTAAKLVAKGAIGLSGRGDVVCYAAADGTVHCKGESHAEGFSTVTGVKDAVEVALDARVQACARLRDGHVTCWGNDRDAVAPKLVAGIAGAAALAVGAHHACALVKSGVQCWGSDNLGQLAREPRHLHEVRDPLPGATAIDALVGHDSTFCGRSGKAWRCWGTDYKSYTDRTRRPPAEEPAFAGATAIAFAWGTTCIVRADRTVACWGANHDGAVGDGTEVAHDKPFVVPGVKDVVELEAGYTHVCARHANGTVTCWGNNASGQLGTGTTSARMKPTPMKTTEVTHLDLSSNTSCVAHRSGPMQCFGSELGLHGLDPAWLGTAKVLRGMANWACAILKDETVSCMGYNASGSLGDGTMKYQFEHGVPAKGLAGIVELSDSCALSRGGEVWCWGHRERDLGLGDSLLEDCNLGDGPPWPCVRTPTKLPIAGVAHIVSGLRTTCAQMTDKTVHCWGDASGWPDLPAEPPVTVVIRTP